MEQQRNNMIHFGRELTGHLDAVMSREWLVTNGLGGYAMGSISGARTRRYHSLLTASLQPPTQRTLMVAGLDAWIDINGRRSPLVTHEWAAGVVLPDGYRHLESFHLDGTIPTFVWTLGDVQIVQRIWMAHGRNTTYITYTYTRGASNVRLVIKPLCAYRDHHTVTKGGYPVDVRLAADSPWPSGQMLTVRADNDRATVPPRSVHILTSLGNMTPAPEWWWSFHLAQEKKRGMDNQEDLFSAATISAELALHDTLALAFTIEDEPPDGWQAALQAERERQDALLRQAALDDAPPWIRQLGLAADQFVVTREIGSASGTSVLAGYPWFSDWGRDTMIALPGLTLAVGRQDEAAAVLRTFARYVDRGMLPNRFPDEGRAPEYNTADATLWYFQAVRALAQQAGPDHPAVRELYPVLIDILEWHVKGTRFNIGCDTSDGLLYAGEAGLQLTWMDAKIDDWVVTPRVGKPVEINALWANALRIVADLAAHYGDRAAAERFGQMAERAHASFGARFWYSGGYLYDVIDGPEGDDPTLRPNQIFAVSLPIDLLDERKARAVVDICARELVTSYGLRSLAPDETDYVGHYGGDRLQRDSCYHQGTVWSWLLGPFVSAHYKVYRDADVAYSYLKPLADHLKSHGLGTLSEIFDGDPPHTPRGAIAQAWSVAEVLRVWRELEAALAPTDLQEAVRIGV